MKKFQIGIAIILVAIAGFITWYNVSQKTDAPTTTEPLILGLHPWIGNGLYYVAKEKGFFDAQNINAQLVSYTDGAVGKQLIASGKVHVLASLTPETAVVLSDAGNKIKVVAMTDTSEGADGIIATQDIKTLSDLKGKKVAFEGSSPSHFYLSYLLDKEGLTTKDLQAVNVTAPDAAASFFSGNVAAAVTWEPWLSTATDRAGGHLIATTKNDPILPALVIVREDTMQQRPQDIRAMLRGLFAAREWILNNQDEAVKIIAKNFQITEQEVIDQLPTFRWFSYEDNQTGFTTGQYSAKSLVQTAGDLWLKLGLIKNEIRADEIVDASLLKNL